MEFNHSDFKRCLGSFASGVTVVTIMDASNKPQAITVSSFSSLSLEPPMVSFNLGKESHLHSKLLNSDCFAVNILAGEQAALSKKFSESTGDRWEGVKYEPGINACPLLDGVLAHIECLTDNIYDGGDHSIITGLVINLKTFDNKKPLIYYMGGYYALGN